MASERVREPEFYRRVTGREYPGEYGERLAARRRGAKFEANLHMNNAALLRRAVAPLYRLDAEAIVVRNFAEEAPGRSDRLRAVRLHRTRQLLRDLAAGREVPHLLIQPQLRLPTGDGADDFIFVTPDFMVLNPAIGMFVPGEEKSFIVRDGVADRSDLDGTRRQAAVQLLALRAEARRLGAADRVGTRAAFVFATPYGLVPAPAFEDELGAEIREILRAIELIALARQHLAERRAVDGARLEALVDEIPIAYRESCIGRCILASVCKRRFDGFGPQLGDAVRDVLGDAIAITRALELLTGAAPRDEHETLIAVRLRDAIDVLGPPAHEILRRRAG